MTLSPAIIFVAASLLLVSCAKDEVVDDTPTPVAAEPFIEPDSETSVIAPPTQELSFADPNTTSKLITAAETKTVVGKSLKQKPIVPKEENVVTVTPPSLPDTQLPEASSN